MRSLRGGYRPLHDNNPVDHRRHPRDRRHRPTRSRSARAGHCPDHRRAPGRARWCLDLRDRIT